MQISIHTHTSRGTCATRILSRTHCGRQFIKTLLNNVAAHQAIKDIQSKFKVLLLRLQHMLTTWWHNTPWCTLSPSSCSTFYPVAFSAWRGCNRLRATPGSGILTCYYSTISQFSLPFSFALNRRHNCRVSVEKGSRKVRHRKLESKGKKTAIKSRQTWLNGA